MLHNLTAPCNANCRCSSSRYYPVCGRDEVQYFSPCFAGCASYNLNNKKKVLNSIQVVDLACLCFIKNMFCVESVLLSV